VSTTALSVEIPLRVVPGDQLLTAREVVEKLAINPNT
jgi:DNA-binding transcriptional regulator YhcF (GntR family)